MKTRNSEIDNSYVINEEKWVLTLARKANRVHQQHAFFILEGIEDNQAVVWFMDLVGSPLLPNIQNAHIRMEKFATDSEVDLAQSPLLFRCQRRMMDLQSNDAIAPLYWYIEKENAERLIRDIELDKANPPVFNIFGKNSFVTGSSAYSSSKDRGHNCFTYAKAKIEKLEIPTIKVNCDNTAYCIDHIVGISSLTLRNRSKSNHYCPSFTKLLIGGTVVTAGLAIAATRHYYPSS